MNNLALHVPVGSIESYISYVNQIPMLSLEEEQTLATQLQQETNLEAARRLVLAHLRFVVRIARGFQGYGLPMADLIQEGNIGLMKAVKRFDPSHGVRLVSFAVHWIKAEMHEFIIRNWRIVKMATTKAQRKLFFNLRQFKNRLGLFSFSDKEVSDVAKTLGVTREEVREMEMRLGAKDASLDPLATDDDNYITPLTRLAAPNADPAEMVSQLEWQEHHSEQLRLAFATLDKRSQDILQKRWLNDEKTTLFDLAAQYDISAERIRQLEQAAMKKLKQVMVS